jgi:MFS-type transporter involved in bile tolerance (Atg22 family)
MIAEIAYFRILGFPLIYIAGTISFIALLGTALIPTINKKIKKKIPLKYHTVSAIVTIIFASIHVFLAFFS